MIRLSNVLCLINERRAVVDIRKRHVDHVLWTDRRAVLMSSCRVICRFFLFFWSILYIHLVTKFSCLSPSWVLYGWKCLMWLSPGNKSSMVREKTLSRITRLFFFFFFVCSIDCTWPEPILAFSSWNQGEQQHCCLIMLKNIGSVWLWRIVRNHWLKL